jgi:hypothetical protein
LGVCSRRRRIIVNRLNVSISASQTATGADYVPKWTEFASSVLVIAGAVDILPKTKSVPPAGCIANSGPAVQA